MNMSIIQKNRKKLHNIMVLVQNLQFLRVIKQSSSPFFRNFT